MFPFPIRQGKLVMYNDNIHNIIMYYIKHGALEAEIFEMTNNHDYGNGINEQKQGLPSGSSNYD